MWRWQPQVCSSFVVINPSLDLPTLHRGVAWSPVWVRTPHNALCCKVVSPPGTEPRLRQQKTIALPLAVDHIDKLVSWGGRFRNFRRTAKAATDTVVESQRGLKATTSSKATCIDHDDRRVITYVWQSQPCWPRILTKVRGPSRSWLSNAGRDLPDCRRGFAGPSKK